MLTRKEFFKDLLGRGVRTISDLTDEGEGRIALAADPGHWFDLPATELSPALLAVEAERRGIDLGGGGSDELRRAVYQELAQNRPDDDRPDAAR